jgi:hypothetical protein
MATKLDKTAGGPATLRPANALAPAPVNSLLQAVVDPFARAYQTYQQHIGQPFQQAVRGGVRGYFGLPLMSDASSVGREAYRQGEALGFTPGVGMPAGAVRVAAETAQALPSIAGDIGRVIGGMPSRAAARQAQDFAAYQRSIPPKDISPLTAFHGTPHTFPAEEGAPLGRFRSEKIGSGEGAQAYGYGMYFAESPGTAGYYKEVLSEKMSGTGITKINNSPQIGDPEYGDILALDMDDAPAKTLVGKEAINYLQNYLQRFLKYDNKEAKLALDWLEIAKRENWSVELPGKDAKKIEGSLYKVDIPDEIIDKMLDWNKPLSQQPGMVKKVFENGWQHALYRQRSGRNVGDFTGADLVRSFGTDTRSSVMASEQLRQAGIPGIRYLDQSSRAGGEGTRNIVVFPGEEQNVKILSRD